jgi:hypothetical protein
MRIEIEDLLTGRTVWPNAERGGAETPMSVSEVGPTAEIDHSAIHAPDVGTRLSKRDRTPPASESRIDWESLLAGGMAVAVALLTAMVMLAVAAFGAQFVA